MSVAYHLWLDEAAKGPFTIGQLRSMWNSGQITSETHYTPNAGVSWHHLSDIIDELEPKSNPVISTPKIQKNMGQTQNVRVSESRLKESPDYSLLSIRIKTTAIIFFILLVILGPVVWIINITKTQRPSVDDLIANMQATGQKMNEAAINQRMARISMSKQDVLRSLGTPDSIEPPNVATSKDIKETWIYGNHNFVGFGWDNQVNVVSDSINFDNTDQSKQMSEQSLSNLTNNAGSP